MIYFFPIFTFLAPFSVALSFLGSAFLSSIVGAALPFLSFAGAALPFDGATFSFLADFE